jgi:hypothetical protein
VVTAPVTAATAFLVRETGLRGAPCPKLERRLPIGGRSTEVDAMVGYASGSVRSDLIADDELPAREEAMVAMSTSDELFASRWRQRARLCWWKCGFDDGRPLWWCESGWHGPSVFVPNEWLRE